jgi:hypothetical protein
VYAATLIHIQFLNLQLKVSLVFSTTAHLYHVTPLPAGTTFQTALKTLQNHDLLIRLDSELAHYETLAPPPDSPNTGRYKVTDHMHTLPKGLWDTTVTFEALITNVEDGVHWTIKAPLGLVQTSSWRLIRSTELQKEQGDKESVDRAEEKEGWSLVEDVEIKASRLLAGTVKAKCEQNWRGIHAKFMSQLTAEALEG